MCIRCSSTDTVAICSRVYFPIASVELNSISYCLSTGHTANVGSTLLIGVSVLLDGYVHATMTC